LKALIDENSAICDAKSETSTAGNLQPHVGEKPVSSFFFLSLKTWKIRPDIFFPQKDHMPCQIPLLQVWNLLSIIALK